MPEQHAEGSPLLVARAENSPNSLKQKQVTTFCGSFSDRACCASFLPVLLFLAFTWVYAMGAGRWVRITSGIDYKDRLCGFSPGVEQQPYLFWCASSNHSNLMRRRLAAEEPGEDKDLNERMNDALSSRLDEGTQKLQSTFQDLQRIDKQLEVYKPICVHKCPDGNEAAHKCFDMDTQEEVYRTDYATVPFRGHMYCAPNQPALMKDLAGVLDGPVHAIEIAILNVRARWKSLLVVAVISLLCGYFFVWVISIVASPVLVFSVILTSILAMLLGAWIIAGASVDDLAAKEADLMGMDPDRVNEAYLFSVNWLFEFIAAVEQFAFIFATQAWFFTGRGDVLGIKGPNYLTLPQGAVEGAIRHGGTLALGSFVIASWKVVSHIRPVVSIEAVAACLRGHHEFSDIVDVGAIPMWFLWRVVEILLVYFFKLVYVVVACKSRGNGDRAVEHLELYPSRAIDHARQFVMDKFGQVSFFGSIASTMFEVQGREYFALFLLEGVTKVFQTAGMVLVSAMGAAVSIAAITYVPVDNLGQGADNMPLLVICAIVIAFMMAALLMRALDVMSDIILFTWVVDRVHHPHRDAKDLLSYATAMKRDEDTLPKAMQHLHRTYSYAHWDYNKNGTQDKTRMEEGSTAASSQPEA
mmetsp:Transcript_111679/g.320868  ORF Transcript_111679/g.320868 Transcript_111679/m.320868 type:complete len:640 (-) Transcript_111679:210-2129(-)